MRVEIDLGNKLITQTLKIPSSLWRNQYPLVQRPGIKSVDFKHQFIEIVILFDSSCDNLRFTKHSREFILMMW